MSEKIYVVTITWASEDINDMEVPLAYRTLEAARAALKEEVAEIRSESWVKDDWEVEETEDSYETWEDGNWLGNHFSVQIYETFLN